MSSDVINRSVVRIELASLIDTALVAAGAGIVQEVFDYRTDRFLGKSPIVVVCSRGADRDKTTEVSTVQSDCLLYIFTFVLASDQDNWGLDDAEDRLDQIEKEITDVLVDNFYHENYWISIEFDQQSQVEPIVIGDLGYLRETFFVKADMYSD